MNLMDAASQKNNIKQTLYIVKYKDDKNDDHSRFEQDPSMHWDKLDTCICYPKLEQNQNHNLLKQNLEVAIHVVENSISKLKLNQLWNNPKKLRAYTDFVKLLYY